MRYKSIAIARIGDEDVASLSRPRSSSVAGNMPNRQLSAARTLASCRELKLRKPSPGFSFLFCFHPNL